MTFFEAFVGKLQQTNPKILWEIAYTIIAAIGGAARYTQTYIKTGEFHFWKFFASTFVSSFSGVIFFHAANIIGINSDSGILLAGLGGFMGAEATKFVYEMLTHKIKE